MSTLAPSLVLTEDLEKFSPFSFCKVGSTVTLEQGSVRRVAVRSLISLWRRVGNPPFEQERACSVMKLLPQAQFVGRSTGVHPYLRAIASLKSLLCRENPCSDRGRTFNQLEAPLSWASFTANERSVGRLGE